MKKYILILIFYVIFTPKVFSQDSLGISENWTELRQKLTFRTQIALELVKQLEMSKKIEKAELKNTQLYATELKRLCENDILNKDSIELIEKTNSKLTTFLAQNLVILEFDNRLKNKEETRFIIDQLSVIEQQICIASKKYNISCKKSNKEDLIFNLKCTNEPVQVEFD